MENELKDTLLKIAERHALAAVDDIYELAGVYVKSTDNIYDDTALEFLKSFKQSLKDKVDGIHQDEQGEE